MPQLRNHSIVRKTSASSTAIADDWREQSACRDADPESFFPHPTNTAGIQEALDHCAVCPVRAACLQFALETRQEHGIWGGLTETELREQRGLNRPRGKGCGTDGGWRVHNAHGTTPCQPCQDAHQEWLRQDRQRRLDDEHAAAGGTAYGATLHKRLGEPACPLCATADQARRHRQADQSTEWRNQHKEQVNARRAEQRRQARENKQAEQARRTAAKDSTDKCGTYPGYRRHMRHKTPVCQPCREANTTYKQDAKQRKNAGIAMPQQRKISDAQYVEIFRRREEGDTLAALAAEFGVSKTHVRRIIQQQAAA